MKKQPTDFIDSKEFGYVYNIKTVENEQTLDIHLPMNLLSQLMLIPTKTSLSE